MLPTKLCYIPPRAESGSQGKQSCFESITVASTKKKKKSHLALCLFDLVTFKLSFGVLQPFIFCPSLILPAQPPSLLHSDSLVPFQAKLVWTAAVLTGPLFCWPAGVSLHVRHYLT